MRLPFLLLFMTSVYTHAQEIVRDTLGIYAPALHFHDEAYRMIPVDYSASDLLKQVEPDDKSLTVMRVDLVYTQFKRNPEFDQEALNRMRMEQLKVNWPEVADPMIEWHWVCQDGPMDYDSAQQVFHGFVVYYRPPATPEKTEEEIAFLDALFPPEAMVVHETVAVVEDTIPRITSEMGELPAFGEEGGTFSTITRGKDGKCLETYYKLGSFKRREYRKLRDSLLSLPNCSWVSSSWENRMFIKESSHSRYVSWTLSLDTCAEVVVPTVYEPFLPVYPDWMGDGEYDVVSKVFERNPHWTNSLVIIDVTGSMSPYIAKTMAWVKERQKAEQVKAFVFFNDGDNRPDRTKQMGKVGGIYGSLNSDFATVYQTLKSTMRKGCGGDGPENNVEATIKGLQEYPDCDEVIMVADNWATPRDLDLVRKLDKPVHVILCGVRGEVNLAYLQLAYDTGGSVHTIEEDMEMAGIQEGVKFKIGRSHFTVTKGRIVRSAFGK